MKNAMSVNLKLESVTLYKLVLQFKEMREAILMNRESAALSTYDHAQVTALNSFGILVANGIENTSVRRAFLDACGLTGAE